MRRLRAGFLELSCSNEMLPIFNVFPLRVFHRCISTGMITAVAASSAMGLNN